MIVLVCGDRDWQDKELIKKELSKLPPGTIIVEGGARGADTLAKQVAKELGFEVREYKAKWKEYHKAAGPIRNREMLKKEDPDKILAFHDNIEESKGTKDMIKISKKAGKDVKLVRHRRKK
jgi:hypothetical protein